MNEIYDEYTDLLGAYALDAVEPDEREAVELHLLECPRCRAEVAEHREAAAFLSQSGAQAPDGVWDRIVAELAPEAPPLRLRLAAQPPAAAVAEEPDRPAAPAVVTPLVQAPSARRRPSKLSLTLLAAAACIVAFLGVVTVSQTQRMNRLETAMQDPSLERLATVAVADAPVKVGLEGDIGRAEVVVSESGQGYLIMKDLPAPAEGDVYQLWGKLDETIISLGTFGGGSEIVPFSVDSQRIGDLELFAVTQERAPGVPSSVNDPVLAGTV